MSEVYIGVIVSSGEVYHVALQTELRSPARPRGDGWVFDDGRGVWTNPLEDAYIEYFIALNERSWAHRKDSRGGPAYDAVSVVSWRRLTQAEHEQFNADRPYRNALRDNNGVIEYDIAAARECQRNRFRLQRSGKLPMLDILWMRAVAANDTELAAALEEERQLWRDAPIDPRIDAAQSVEELKQIKVE
jgi:hypothetical protein